MIDQIFIMLNEIDELFWFYAGVPSLLIIGLYLSIKSRFFQIRQIPEIIKIFKNVA